MAIVNFIHPSRETRTRATHPILVRVTPTVQRDYLRRGVFAHLRTANAAQMLGATAVFLITAQEAEVILNDAATQRIAADAPRGTRKAYGSHSEYLTAQVDRDRNRGLISDPGCEVAKVRDTEGWRRFKVGDVAIYYSKFVHDENHGQTLSVTLDYGFQCVLNKHGGYYQKDGSRIEYRWVYYAKFLTGPNAGEKFFFPAHALRSPSSKITHLRLVK